MTMASVAALDYDIRHLEGFADSCGVSQLKLCFTETRSHTPCAPQNTPCSHLMPCVS